MEAPQLAFTPEQIAERGQDNWEHVLFATIAYLKEQGHSVEEWAIYLGEQFAPGWGHGYTAREVVERCALNVASAGATVRSISGNDDWAECVVGDWPPTGKLASERFHQYFGVTSEDADPFWEIFRPIARYLGFAYEWNRESDQKLSFTFWRE